MIAECFIGKKRRMGSAACHSHRRHAAMLAAAFTAVTLGVANQASADRSPANCTANGPASSITVLIEAAAIDIKHGDQLCITVEILNTCPGCCDTTLLDTELVMPDSSIVTISVDATVLFGQSFVCPSADPRCATASNCTLSGGEKGYKYIIAHADEHGPLPSGCPPVPPPGSGEVSCFLRSTAGVVHTATLDGSANMCQTARIPIEHACCDPCSGECLNLFPFDPQGDPESQCLFPKVFTADKSCAEATCTPKVCLGPVPPCEAGQTCDPATGTCVNLTDPPLSTPCVSDENVCTTEHCDGLGKCVPFHTVCDTPDFCDDGLNCTIDSCNANNPPSCCEYSPRCPGRVCCADGGSCEDDDACTDDFCGPDGCCAHSPHDCPPQPCFTVSCNPASGCVYAPVTCDDLDECTDDRCDPGLNRCVFTDNGLCRQATCRTPGFWGTHGNNAKRNSKNITQAVINACGGSLSVCGECINSTAPVNNAASATEALCVAPKGAIVLQNARQLTALALNCCISGFGDDCGCDAGLSDLLSDCNNACLGLVSNRTNAQCRNEIDCFNNGGLYDPGTGTCGDGGPDNCHTRPLVNADLGLDFSTPGPAGGETDCHAANGNKCAILALPNCSLKNGAGAACCGKDSCPVLPTLVDECDKDAPCSGAEVCGGGSCACFFTAAGNTRCFDGEHSCDLPACTSDCDCAAGSACSDTCCGLKCIPLCGAGPAAAAAEGGAGTSTSK